MKYLYVLAKTNSIKTAVRICSMRQPLIPFIPYLCLVLKRRLGLWSDTLRVPCFVA